ncbi:MAG: PD40 domain-containing protein, partial [Bacteroidales bacterium]|nr:PD40 domain-containing protein [Bacteroidales bacterium]
MSDKNNNLDPSLDDIYSKIRKDKDIEKKEKTTVPFKFLDSYTLEDKDIFFGRDNEIEEIYRKFYKDKILLVYGKSGTGKSSVVNCGLMSRIPKQDIYTINVRCGKVAYQNFITELKKHSQEDTDDSVKLVEDIFFKCFKPVAIIFDQFEEAFILSDKKERQKLVQELKKLLESELNINLVFIIREEYYANLTEFEEKIPEIESNRIRIEKMSKATVKDAIEKPCEVCNVGIEEGLPEKIIGQLIWQSGGLELTWLQILMDKLYKIATDRDPVNPVIKHEDLTKLGRMGNVLSDFLDEQLQLMPNGDLGEAVLKTMISTDGTKKPVNLNDISQTLQTTGHQLDDKEINDILMHFVNVRIITDKDEQGYYELRHDGIAARIYERMTAIEKELIEVKTFIENCYKNYEKRKVLLTDNDLKYIALYESKLFLNKELNDFLQTSKKEIQKTKRRKRNIVVAASISLFIIMAGFTIWALNERGKAVIEKNKAQANNFNFIAKEVVDQDPTTALRLAEYALTLDTTNEQIQNNLRRIYYDNNFYKIIIPHESWITSVAFSPDGKTILTGSWDKTARLWDLEGNEVQVFTGHEDGVKSSVFSPDGKTILTGSWDNTSRLWDLDGNELQVFKGHKNSVISVAFSPDGKTILTGSYDKTARLWDLEGNELQIFKGHEYSIFSVAYSPDGKTILTGSGDKTARLWDLSGAQLRIFKGHEELILSVAFSPDGKTILTGSGDNTARLWDLEGNELQVFKGHEGSFYSVAFSPDGKTILTGSYDKTARLWDLEGNESQVFKGHEHRINSVAFSTDGKTILTGSDDGTARLWDLEENQLQAFKGHEDGILSVAFSSDGKFIVTGSDDKTARLW